MYCKTCKYNKNGQCKNIYNVIGVESKLHIEFTKKQLQVLGKLKNVKTTYRIDNKLSIKKEFEEIFGCSLYEPNEKEENE